MVQILTDQGVVYEVEDSVRRVMNLIDNTGTFYISLTNAEDGKPLIIFKSHIVSIF